MNRLKAAGFIFFFLFTIQLYSQVDFRIEKGAKKIYTMGDTIVVAVKVKVDPHTCTDGMSRTKNYLSGVKVLKKQGWIELEKGIWINRFWLSPVANKKSFGLLTISRRTDKDNLVKSIAFNYSQTGKK